MTQLDPHEDDLAPPARAAMWDDDWTEDEFDDWYEDDRRLKEEPVCPACCDAGCRQCRPTRWDLWRWRWRDRWWRLRDWFWRLRHWRQYRADTRDDPYPF